MKRVVIFASGSGSNAENLINFFQDSDQVTITMVLTNNPHAKVIDRCKRLKTPVVSFSRSAQNAGILLDILNTQQPDLIVLAGYLWKFPENILAKYPNKVINVHPALLPKFGGKGMYGMNVHEAVVANKETETGITFHYVNEHYDEGAIISQNSCKVDKNDTAEDVAKKISVLEMANFPKVVAKILKA